MMGRPEQDVPMASGESPNDFGAWLQQGAPVAPGRGESPKPDVMIEAALQDPEYGAMMQGADSPGDQAGAYWSAMQDPEFRQRQRQRAEQEKERRP
jgi:hypothetical protein